MEKVLIFLLPAIFWADTMAFALSGSMLPINMPSHLNNNYWATQFQQQLPQQQQQQMQITQQPLANSVNQQQLLAIPGNYLPSTSVSGASPPTQSAVNLPQLPAANQLNEQYNTLMSSIFPTLNFGFQPQQPQLNQPQLQQQNQQQQIQQQQQQQSQQQNYQQKSVSQSIPAPPKPTNFSKSNKGRINVSSRPTVHVEKASITPGMQKINGTNMSSSAFPAPVPEVAGMQSLLERVRRLQLEEQTQLAERGKLLRQQQDLLLAQQGASLKKQQTQLQAFQKQIDRQKKMYKQSIINRMGSDVIRSIIREEVNGPAMNVNISPKTSQTKTFRDTQENNGLTPTSSFPVSGNMNSAFKNIDLSGVEKLKMGPISESGRLNSAMGGRSPVASLDLKRNTPFLPSTFSSSSSSASSLLSSSSPSSSASSSASSYTLSSPQLLDTPSRITNTGALNTLIKPHVSKSLANSWSVAVKPNTMNSPRNLQHSPGILGSPLVASGTSSRSLLRNVGLDKTRLFTREYPSSIRFNRNKELGSNLNLNTRTKATLQERPLQLLNGEGLTYTTYPVSLGTPRYVGGLTARRKDRKTIGTRNGLLQESIPGTGLSRSALPSPNKVSELDLSPRGFNPASTGSVLESYSRSGQISPSHQQQLQRSQWTQLRRQQSNRQQRLFQPINQPMTQRYQFQQRSNNVPTSSWTQRRYQDTRQGRGQAQGGAAREMLLKPRPGLTQLSLEGIEVKATPARRLRPGGPLRIGLDINVRHGVYPIESLKQTSA